MKRILNKESRAAIELMIANDLITKDIAEKYFPELKESEDEKIRKALINVFATHKDYEVFFGVSVEDIHAWLEKQGKKTKPIEGFNTEFERQVSCLIASAMNKDYEYTKDFVKWTSDALLNYAKLEIEKNSMGISEATKKKLEDNLNKALEKETPESRNKFLEKQGEQKPDDKVEPKFKVGDKIKLSREPKYPAREIIAIKNDAYYFDELVYLPLRWQDEWELVVQKPAEWSKEDEVTFSLVLKHLDMLLDNAKGCSLGWAFDLKNDIQFIKSLKDRVQPQPKQEWNEEDVRNIQDIDSVLFYDKNLSEDTCMRLRNWLKSLKERYTWKPSDEQMHYLYWIANVKLGDSVVEQEVSKHLNELYQDLKKLKV